MKRVMLDVPDMICVISVTYIYRDEKTFDKMVGTAIITNNDNPSVLSGKEAYILCSSDRKEQKDE